MSEQNDGTMGIGKTTNEFGGETLVGEIPTMRAGDEMFGRYRLKHIAGVGGMGVVWLAEDGKLNQEVALKFVPDTLRHDESAIDDLKKQTKIGLKLSHPNIVRVAGFEDDGEHSAIVMEYIDGPTLAAMRIDQPAQVFEADVLHPYAAQLLDALEYAHVSAGMVHRDLKPANLMVNANDHVKVTDFGIACSIKDSVSRLTLQPKSGSGTLLYMSPQQMLGTAPPSEADDIYSLGATLFELMAGVPPFYSGDVQTQIKEIRAPSVTERRRQEEIEGEEVPVHWEAVIEACLAKDPQQRPRDIAEIRKGLAGGKFARAGGTRQGTAAAKGVGSGGGGGIAANTTNVGAELRVAGSRPTGLMVGAALGVLAAGFGIWTLVGSDKGDADPQPPPVLPGSDFARHDAEQALARFEAQAVTAREVAGGAGEPGVKRKAWADLVAAMEGFVYPYDGGAVALQREAAAQMTRWQVEEQLGQEVNKRLLVEVEQTFDHARSQSQRSDLGAAMKAGLWESFIAKTSGLELSSGRAKLDAWISTAKKEEARWAASASAETPQRSPGEREFFAGRSAWNSYGKKELLRRVQGVLYAKSIYPHTPDGAFGPVTYTSLLTYQKGESLPQSGVLDEPTLGRLGLAAMAEPAYSRPQRSKQTSPATPAPASSGNGWSEAVQDRIRNGGSFPVPPGFR